MAPHSPTWWYIARRALTGVVVHRTTSAHRRGGGSHDERSPAWWWITRRALISVVVDHTTSTHRRSGGSHDNHSPAWWYIRNNHSLVFTSTSVLYHPNPCLCFVGTCTKTHTQKRHHLPVSSLSLPPSPPPSAWELVLAPPNT